MRAKSIGFNSNDILMSLLTPKLLSFIGILSKRPMYTEKLQSRFVFEVARVVEWKCEEQKVWAERNVLL